MKWCWCGIDVAQQEYNNIKLYASAFIYIDIDGSFINFFLYNLN